MVKKEFKNILIVRTDRIGDVVLTTPSIKALREAYPNAKISILVNPATRDLVEGNGYLNEILVDDRQYEHKGKGFLKLVRILRQRKFDLAIIFHTKRRTNLLCSLAGIPWRVGYKNNKLGFLLTDPIEDKRHLGRKHEAEYCLDVLKHLGIKADGVEMLVPIQSSAQQWLTEFEQVHQIKKADQIIAVHPGASDPSKCWPETQFAETINILMKCYPLKIVLIGAKSIKDVSQKVSVLTSSEIIDMTGKTTVGQLAALLKRCSLLISNDSGPVHVAAGVGTAVVSIFTRNQPGINPERWRPLGEKVKIICVPSEYKDNLSFKKAGPVDKEYLELISTQAVLEAVDALLKLC